MLTDRDDALAVAEAIAASAQTRKIGACKVWVTPVEYLVRVRTGELNGEAL